jgi:hypothetical protein
MVTNDDYDVCKRLHIDAMVMRQMEYKMNTRDLMKEMFRTSSLLILVLIVLTGCKAVEVSIANPVPTGVATVVSDTSGSGAVEEDFVQEPIDTETGLSAHLEMPESLTIGKKINLKFVLTNDSDTPLYILQWYTPLEGIGGEIFRVTYEGRPVPYQGILASRTPPTAEAYVLLNPGESVSAVVDLAEAFDFSKAGAYRVQFISPRISHVALSETEMASTMEELGPINIPSNEVSVELVESPPGAGLSHILAPEEAQKLIEVYLRDQKLDLGVESTLPVEELPFEGVWEALGAQIFRVNRGKFLKESFLIKGSEVLQLGAAGGGQGLTSLVISDLDQDGLAELLYAYSFGSDPNLSRIGMYAPAYDEYGVYEADMRFLGHLMVYSEDTSQVGVRVVEGDQDTKTLRFLDTIGNLTIEGYGGDVNLVLHVLPGLPDEIQQRIITGQNNNSKME